jgi:putative transposase
MEHHMLRRDGSLATRQIAGDDKEKDSVALALDCRDRAATGHAATTEGIKGENIRDLMVIAVGHRFGCVNRLPITIE